MPKTRWGRALVYVYCAGYVFYIFAAAIGAWSKLPTNNDWAYYVGFQFAYGVLWPILVLLNLIGIRW